MQEFIQGLKLSELFYSEAAEPILDSYFPQVSYSAALLGWGSEVLGYDDIQSSDHHWGPRFLLFLSAQDYELYNAAIRETLSRNLPHRLRRKFHYYPRDVWLYQIEAQWIKIFEDREFISRCGDVGDELGSIIIAARQVNKLMRLCFLIERKYAPYTKWFGTAFSELQCASELSPIFRDVLMASTWKERESNLARAYRVIARMHNALKITRPIVEDVSNYHGRPYLVFESPDLVLDIVNSFTDEEVKGIKHGLGSVNQFVDSTNQLSNNALVEMLKAVYK
jgi:hypothetical protein